MDRVLDELVKDLCGKESSRKTLGRFVDIKVLQKQLLPLFLSPGMNAIIFYAGKRFGYLSAIEKKLGFEKAFEKFSKEHLKLKCAKSELVKENGKTFVRMYESAHCYGLNLKRNVCFFHAGVLSGLFSGATGKNYVATETKCSANGSEFCEFELKEIKLETALEAAFKA